MKTYDVYSKYHNKINLSRIVPRYDPFKPMLGEKTDYNRLTHMHVRKKSLVAFNLETLQLEERKQPLPTDFKTILELSCRCPYCPVPFNMDTIGGNCAYNCIYCFTSLTFSSLATAFFDSSNPTAPRAASPERVRDTLYTTLNPRGVEPYERSGSGEVCSNITDPAALKKAASQRVPLKFGARNENFQPIEKLYGVSLLALRILKDLDYPFLINTKSDLLLQPPYWDALTESNPLAVQVTLIHDNDDFVKKLEPGAPSATARLKLMKAMVDSGLRVVCRMEPAAAFLNNDDAFLERYFRKLADAGVKLFMGDPWHYTVKAKEIRRMFYSIGVDFDRMFWATSEYQNLGSYVWEKAMYYAKQYGMKAAAFNFHTLPWNDEIVCCMLGDRAQSWSKYTLVHWLKNDIITEGRYMSWKDLDRKYYGHELHPAIRTRLREVMNLELLNAWNPDFVAGLFVAGVNSDGDLIWGFDPSRIDKAYNTLQSMYSKGDQK